MAFRLFSRRAPAAANPAGGIALRTLLQWHWISSAICLGGMLLFAITGFTLNHASQIEAKPVIHNQQFPLPKAQAERLQLLAETEAPPPTLPQETRTWLAGLCRCQIDAAVPEWSADEVYLPMPRPGGDAWLRVSLAEQMVEYEVTDRGWLAYFNDLHKGRHTGEAWRWFIDAIAIGSVVFCVTGLLILQKHAGNRPSTWPLFGLGLLLPALIALLTIH